MKGRFDGRKMSAILIAGFAVVIGVNVYAAVVARQTFGGLVVENSYVASQEYNGWLKEAAEEQALGWTVQPYRLVDGHVALTLSGVPEGAQVSGEARHPLGRKRDVLLQFGADHVSREVLPDGRWTLRLSVRAGDRLHRSESDIR